MTKLSEIFDGFVKTFTMQDPKNPKPRQSVCRECEIVGAGFLFCTSAYIGHLTRVGRVVQIPGMFFSIVTCLLGMSLMMPPADDEVLKVLQEIQKQRIEQMQSEKDD